MSFLFGIFFLWHKFLLFQVQRSAYDYISVSEQTDSSQHMVHIRNTSGTRLNKPPHSHLTGIIMVGLYTTGKNTDRVKVADFSCFKTGIVTAYYLMVTSLLVMSLDHQSSYFLCILRIRFDMFGILWPGKVWWNFWIPATLSQSSSTDPYSYSAKQTSSSQWPMRSCALARRLLLHPSFDYVRDR